MSDTFGVVKGSITVYMSLVFLIIMSFIVSIMESASIQIAKSYKRADTVLAVENVFAEYNIDLLKDYSIFALDTTYKGTHLGGRSNLDAVINRIKHMGAGESDIYASSVIYYTDYGGLGFMNQVVEYAISKYGLDKVVNADYDESDWVQNKEQAENTEKKEADVSEELTGMLSEAQETMPEDSNPISHVSSIKEMSLLELVLPSEMQVSSKSIDTSGLASNRTLNTGFGDHKLKSYGEGTMRLAICEYILDHFDLYNSGLDDSMYGSNALDYGVEYIISGHNSDRKNLESIVGKLLLIRFGVNCIYIQTDEELKAQSMTMAVALCSALSLPNISEVVSHAILLAWAYGEAIMDIRSLLDNKRVPLFKSKESWQLQLSGLLKLGTDEDNESSMDVADGMSYKDYIRVLLYTESKEGMIFGAMDLIEADFSGRDKSYIKMDEMIYGLEINSFYNFRRSISYEFKTAFIYQ
ncbi:MAG: DUF5702 domain-containing protein [Suipraeoptans sp.]